MPAHDVFALLAYWREQPPTHELLAVALGVKPAPPRDPDDPSNIGALIGRHPDVAVRR